MARRLAAIALPVLGLMVWAVTHSADAGAATYKWVDEKGVVHYSDSMPPEAIDRGSVQLNKEGVPIKKTDPAPTPEQRKVMQQEAERQKALAKEQEVTERRDRALRDLYTSEDEIELSKMRALATIDNQAQSAQAYSSQLKLRKQELTAKKESYGQKPVPAAVERELEGIDIELAKQEGLIAQKKKESDSVTAKYEADKVRWREMKARADANAAAAAAARSPSNPSKSPAAANTAPTSASGTAK